MVRSNQESLLLPSRRWHDRTSQGRRFWALLISIGIHVALLYFASDWIERSPLRTPASPFLVNLISAPPREEPTEAPASPQPEAARPQAARPAANLEPEAVAGPGVPDAPALEPEPQPEPPPSPVVEPVRGDSAADAQAEAEPPRPDVVGDVTRRLLEEMERLADAPRSLGARPAPADRRERPAQRLGSAAGITGDLGERGLLYLEQPAYAEWGRRMGVEAEVRFRFWVSAAGYVVRIQTIRKSAYPEFESLAREALSRWRFEPLPRGQEREEWGEVPFVYELRSSESGE